MCSYMYIYKFDLNIEFILNLTFFYSFWDKFPYFWSWVDN